MASASIFRPVLGDLGGDDFEALLVSCDENEVIAAISEAVGIDRTDPPRRAGDQSYTLCILSICLAFQAVPS